MFLGRPVPVYVCTWLAPPMKFLRDADNLAYLRRLTTVGYVLVGYVAMVFLCLLQHDAAMWHDNSNAVCRPTTSSCVGAQAGGAATPFMHFALCWIEASKILSCGTQTVRPNNKQQYKKSHNRLRSCCWYSKDSPYDTDYPPQPTQREDVEERRSGRFKSLLSLRKPVQILQPNQDHRPAKHCYSQHE